MADHRVEAEVTGSVWRIEVSPGDAVDAGHVLMILESMKMEIPVESPVGGCVAEICVALEQSVSEGQVLLILSD
jgi:acetyl-CoA carboxylase biotin carboxyl carrier protein